MDPELTFWLAGGIAALLVGFSKTGMPGLGILIVPLMAMIWDDTSKSVGALLPLLILGDLFAVIWYKRHAQWDKLWQPLLWVLPGMGLAYFVLGFIGDSALKLTLGIIVLALLGVELLRGRLGLENVPKTWWFAGLMGMLAGFATTLGNAAGPVMAIYFICLNMPKDQFMGTQAWFFAIVNVVKVPLFINRDMITMDTFTFNLKVALILVVGAFIGIKVLPKIPQKGFMIAIKILSALAALKLIHSAVMAMTATAAG